MSMSTSQLTGSRICPDRRALDIRRQGARDARRGLAARPARAKLPDAARLPEANGPRSTSISYRPVRPGAPPGPTLDVHAGGAHAPSRSPAELYPSVVAMGSPTPSAGKQLRNAATFSGLPDREQLQSVAGRPKDDIKFWFFGTRTIRRSTAYKEMLDKLDEWHAQVADAGDRGSPQQLRELDDRLNVLGKAAERCVGKNKRGAAASKLVAEVARYRAGVGSLTSTADAAEVPGRMSMGEILGYASAGVAAGDMEDLAERGISARQAVELSRHLSPGTREELARAGVSGADLTAYLAGKPEAAHSIAAMAEREPGGVGLLKEMMEADLPAEPLSAYLEAGVSPRDALAFHRGKQAGGLDRLYADHLLKRTPDSEIKYSQSDVRGVPQLLGSGACNQVYDTTYADGETRVFKPLSPPSLSGQRQVEHGWVASRTGINKFNPQTAMRNVATNKLADALGFDVVAKTELGVQNAPPGGLVETPPSQWTPQLGLVMEKAEGVEGFDTPKSWFRQPEVRKELTKLQLLDALTGQGDRHGGNYFIADQGDGRFKVTGIDNDQCFGKNLTDPNGIRYGPDDAHFGFKGCALPPVVDRDMERSLMALKPQDIDRLLGDALSPEEVDATKQRLTRIQRHVGRLRSQGQIIEPNGWGGRVGRGVFSMPIEDFVDDPSTSYFVRDGLKARQ